MALRFAKLNQKGYTLIELAIATAVLAVMATTVILSNRFVNEQSVANADRTFATEKAIQMYEELRALVSGNEVLGVLVLDNYSNYANYDNVLTTDKKVDTDLATANPADPLSGNIKTDGNWRYLRQVEVNRVANDTYARQVTVKVYLYPGNFISQSNPGILLATVGGIMRTAAQPYQPTQVMDLYILQINNIPSWWSVLPTLAGYMQSDVSDLSSRLQGLQLRTHYITRTSYGRDSLYQPSTNSIDNPSESAPESWVYLYPGFVPQDTGADNWYYDPQTSGDPNSLLMTGNFMVDGASYPVSTSQFNNAVNVSYAAADQYNNAMRYPDELAAYAAVTTAAAAYAVTAGSNTVIQEGTTEISERMLLEGMLSEPASFENSMIINLHGELLPLPPLRNYSDAAKDPGNQLSLTTSVAPMTCNITSPTTGNTNVRVVTHPELLYYPGAATSSSSVTVRLRVYAYYDSEDTGGVLPSGDPRVPAISVFLPDASAKVVGVTAIVGNASSPWSYAYSSPVGPYTAPYSGAVPGDDPAASAAMSFAVSNVGPGSQQTLITLFNTPLRCGEASNPPTPNPNAVEANPSNPNPDAVQANANPEGGGGGHTNTPTNTYTITNTFTHTSTITNTHTDTSTPTNTFTSTWTGTPTVTPTFTNGPCTIAFDNATTIESNSASSVVFNHAVTGVNNVLLVQVNVQNNGNSAQTVTSCTYDGQAMTLAVGLDDTNQEGHGHSAISHGDLETWYLANPPSGASYPVTVNIHSGPATIVAAALSYQGVNQSSPIGATGYVSNQTNGFAPTHFMPITTITGDSWIVGCMELNGTGGITPIGTGETQRWLNADSAIDSEGDDMPTQSAGSYELEYTTGSNTADMEAVELIPCFIGPSPTPTITNTPTNTKSPTAGVVNTNTPTPTSTWTYTTTPVPGEGGLNSSDRLYGSEYIPCAPDAQSGTALSTTSYNNNTYTFTSQDLTNIQLASGYPKNTARWVIDIAMPVTSVFSQSMTIYSGAITTGTAAATIIGQHAIETRLGNGVTTSVITVGANSVTIYPNLSRTYVWCGDASMPPYTEQYQFMGDPRDCPYYDVKFGGVSISNASITIGPNAYNWWFKNGSSGKEMNADGYSGFGASGNNNYWPAGSAINVDIPRFYQIIRQGLLNTTSIWTGTNGFSWYYYGVGGEIGSDQSPASNGIKLWSDPWQTTTTGASVEGVNAILGDSGTWTKSWVASNITGSNSVTWYQRSWLGELYPDKSYLDSWVSYGNLPSVANTTVGLPEKFYLEYLGSVATSGPSGSSDDGFESTNFLPNPGGTGSNSFYNGNNSSTNGTFEHQYDNANGTELSLGVTTYNIYPFPIPDVVNVQRPWDLNGGNPPEWSDAPYDATGMRTSIDIPTVTNSSTDTVLSRLFYDYNQNGSLPTTSPYGSGVIRCSLLSGGTTTQVGYVVETGTAPSGNVGAQTLAETALIYAMRTFLDGGQMAATGTVGHIVQLPLVKIYLASSIPEYSESQSISFTVGSAVTMAVVNSGVTTTAPVTDIWWRFSPSTEANYYTEEYPHYSLGTQGMTETTGNYQEAVSVIYNLEYSNNGGSSWNYVQDDSSDPVTGICNTSSSYAITEAAPWTYNWPVSTATRVLPQGDYLLRVEAYRQNYGEHFAYDTQDLEISW